LEKQIENKIKAYLKTLPNCFYFKTHGCTYSAAGIPDLIICYRGRFVALEVKQPSGKLTKLQEMTLRKINGAGGIAYKVTSPDEVREIIENLDSGGFTK
jgi:hypothetical protein